MKKFTLFFAALLIALGVQAQESSTVEQRGADKGYYPFAAEVTGMQQITKLRELTDSLEIMIQHSHEGTSYTDHIESYLTIYSLPTYGAAHIVFMQDKPVEVGVWTTDTVSTQNGTFKLQSAHGVITKSTCYLGQLTVDRYGDADLKASASYVGEYKLTPANDGKWTVYCTTTGKYLGVNASSGSPVIKATASADKDCYFKIYKVTSKSTERVKYVECPVTLTGPSGNTFTTWQEGWNDFYEFLMEGNYGVTLLNVVYHETSNEITGRVNFPFTVSGNRAEIPVHLNPSDDLNKRFAVGDDNNIVIVESGGEDWYNNPKNQWYIRPVLNEARQFSYAIQNVATKQYIHTAANSYDVSLSEEPTYFTHTSGAPQGQVRFTSIYTSPTTGVSYTTYLIYDGDKVHTKTQSGIENGDVVNLTVTRISGEELGGEDAIGFVRRYTFGTSFWDGGQVALENAPVELQEVFNHVDHEGKNSVGSNHLLYCAETGITVTKMDDVKATFAWANGTDQLVILGVDIVDNIGQAVYADYHLGTAGQNPKDNVYTLKDVFPGEYIIRYWVCNRTDYEEKKNHNLDNTSGSITVTGANYRIMFSQPLVNEQFATNTTWFRLRLHDGLQRYISAQPAYMDDNNHLKLTNNTPPSDNAGLWAVIGDAENGYKFYNRAWGPKYALKTEGNEDAARSYMAEVSKSSTYDIVQKPGDYKFYVKVKGETADKYLNYRDGYLATWNTGLALGNEGSVMTFETVNMEGWDEQTEVLMNDIKKRWRPWIAEPEIGNAYYTVIKNANFAFMMTERLAAFRGLDGKVFKFANIDTASSNRTGKILAVHSDSKVAGIAATETIQDYLQLFHNGNGTFKLYHPQSGRYLKTPDNAETTADTAEAANFTYDMYEDEEGIVAFKTNNQMIHLSKDNLLIMDYNVLADAASRWNVSYSQEAQDLVDLLQNEVKAKVAETAADEYKANCGVPGYATATTAAALNDSITAALASTDLVAAKAMLEAAMQAITAEENAPLFPTDCYFTITNKHGRGSVVYDNSEGKQVDTNNGDAAYLWHNTSVDATNVNHLWGFCYNPAKDEYYLYNVGAQQFASPTGLGADAEGYRYGDQGDTWIFSDVPVAISLTDLGDKYFHIQGGSKTMSISTSYHGSVITYYAENDLGVPFKFDKSAKEFDEELYKEMEKKVVLAGLTYVTDLTKLGNTAVYGISTERGPLAYISGTEGALSTPKNSATNVEANAIENAGEQFAVLRTENTPAGKYYLYNLSKQRFVNTGAAFAENPVAVTSFSATSNNDYPWFVWLGDNKRININASGLLMRTASQATPDEGNRFRIQYVKTDAGATAEALEAIIALETAVAEAQAFLNETPNTVGYPVEAKRTEFQSAIDARASVTAIADAKTAFVAATDVVMPENGKAYKINAWWRNRTWPLTFIENKPDGYACQTRAYVPVENASPAVFVCRKVAEGEYAFITDNGYYFGWQAADKGNNTDTVYQVTYNNNLTPNKFKLVKAVVANNGAGPKLNNEEVFGKFNLYGQRNNAWWHYMFSYSSKNFHVSGSGVGAGTAWYGDNAHTVYYTFEEVDYTLNTIKMNKLEGENPLLTGLEEGMSMSTFSAPYPTVTPKGITAYYAQDISSTTTEDGESKKVAVLQKMRTAIPANQGVVLVGEVGKSGNFKMLPAAGEDVPTKLNNSLRATGAHPVEMSQNGSVDYILGKKKPKGVGFYKASTGSTLAAGKAYFHFENAEQVRNFVLRFGGETTDIEDAVLAPAADNDAIYDLSGRRVNEVTKGGIYIKNGKKFIVK